MNITIVGIGYVGLSSALVLARYNKVILIDVLPEKVEMVNSRRSPIEDKILNDFLKCENLNLFATTDSKAAFNNSDYIIIAVPTNYEEKIQALNTSSIEDIIREAVNINKNATFIIKSTVPIGYTEKISKQIPQGRIIFNPEFLREGYAMYDSLNPSRIILGIRKENEPLRKKAECYANLMIEGIIDKTAPVIYMGWAEAEAVKLFSNAYLALRVAFFNEIDTLAEKLQYNSQDIITGVSLDPRIGKYYNNPSFGYGGYCLPKDTKQLLAHFKELPGCLVEATIESNEIRKEYILKTILSKILSLPGEVIVGIYRLSMKAETTDIRGSTTIELIKGLQAKDIKIIIYEPNLETEILGCAIVEDLTEFKRRSSIIIANRVNNELGDAKEKVYSRDIFSKN